MASGVWLPMGRVDVRAAAEGGHLAVFRWARVHGCPWAEDGLTQWECCANAAAGGHLEVLKWARAHYCPWDAETCAAPLRAGTLRC